MWLEVKLKRSYLFDSETCVLGELLILSIVFIIFSLIPSILVN